MSKVRIENLNEHTCPADLIRMIDNDSQKKEVTIHAINGTVHAIVSTDERGARSLIEGIQVRNLAGSKLRVRYANRSRRRWL